MYFASAAFLAGLALLTVPWWLHRLNAHAAEQHTFSSLFLMRPSEAPVNMRRKLKHLVLLALRWLLLLAACLSFAEPFVELSGASAPAPDEPVAHQLIVVDTSLSMNRATGRGRAIEVARRKAVELLDDLPDGARAGIVSAADQLVLLAPLTDDRDRLDTAIAGLEAGAARLELGGLLTRINTLSETLLAPGERLTVHLLTDFQATALPDQFTRLISKMVWPVKLHPLVTDDAENWAVTRLGFSASGELEVAVQGFASPAVGAELVLFQDGDRIGGETVEIPASGTATASFELPPAGRGATGWRAELRVQDPLPEDNARNLVRADDTTTPLSVLTFDDHGYNYLHAAVRAAAPRYEPVRVATLDDEAAPVIVVLDPGTLPDDQERTLARYLRSGGAVLMTAGINTRSSGRIPVINAPLAAARFDQTERGAVANDRSHPAVGSFDAWYGLKFFQTVQLAAPPAGEVILSLDDGTPLLIEYRVGAGMLLLLTTALDPAWSSLVVRPAFVSFTASLLGYLAEDLLPVEALVAQPFAIPAQSVQLFDERGEPVLDLADTIGRPTVSLERPGIYQLRTPASRRLLAVNTDLRESDLTRADQDYLDRWQDLADQANAYLEHHQSQLAAGNHPAFKADSEDHAEATRSVPLAPWLLALLALVVFIEPLLANTGLIRNRTEGATAQ